MERLKGILISSFADSDQNEKQEGTETKEEEPSVQNEAYSNPNPKDVAEKQILEYPEKLKACSEKLQIDPFKHIEKIKAYAEKLQIDPLKVVECIQMSLPRTPEYNQSPGSFGSKRNAQDDGADIDYGSVASQVDATFKNETYEDIFALDDKEWDIGEETTSSFPEDDSKAEAIAKQTLPRSPPKVKEATAPQTQTNDPSKVNVLAVTTTDLGPPTRRGRDLQQSRLRRTVFRRSMCPRMQLQELGASRQRKQLLVSLYPLPVTRLEQGK
eukprot:scaffold74151_cov46-Cyclotella_meneghiniana.AAC.1